MAGFRKAKAEQAALKMGIYGAPGSGKTFTSLLIAEGLVAGTDKRIAYVDTERGTDFYCKAVPSRAVHPEAFDFDAIYTKSISEVLSAIKSIKPTEYGAIVIDSITHIWEACRQAYNGKTTRAGTIPMHAWGSIKRPYKELMGLLLSLPVHVLICGRQGTEYETDEETEELKAIGHKMKAEGETPYEPHILIRMEAQKPKKTNEQAKIIAYVEKDRTGILAGRSFVNPTFMSLVKPLVHLLGDKQAQVASDDETAAKDAENLAADEAERASGSAELLRQWKARIQLANDAKELKDLGKQITPQVKAKMLPADVAEMREVYQERERELASKVTKPKGNIEDVRARLAKAGPTVLDVSKFRDQVLEEYTWTRDEADQISQCAQEQCDAISFALSEST